MVKSEHYNPGKDTLIDRAKFHFKSLHVTTDKSKTLRNWKELADDSFIFDENVGKFSYRVENTH